MYNLTAIEQSKAREYSELRFRDASRYEDALSVACFELDYISIEEVASNDESLIDLYNRDEFVPENVLMYGTSDALPVRINLFDKSVTVIYSCKEQPVLDIPGYKVVYLKVPSVIFFKKYLRNYGKHDDLLPVPPRTLLDRIYEEGISLKAADITISTDGNLGRVYYNVAKKFVSSNMMFTKADVRDIISILCFKSPYDFTSRKPKDVGVVVNENYRGRVNICSKYEGFMITIRLLPNSYFNSEFEDLNLKPKTVDFIRKYILSEQFGLRLIVGATMSGKNTTALACLNSVIRAKRRKVVSVEMPVEQLLPGLEQIDCTDSDEYNEAVTALLRQNPDYVYITEMSEKTAEAAIRITNTGKILMSTLHANSCADTFARLQEITGMSMDKLVQVTHCILYQALVRDEENNRVVPVNSMLYLDDDRKLQLYGLPYGESLKLLKQWEEADV